MFWGRRREVVCGRSSTSRFEILSAAAACFRRRLLRVKVPSTVTVVNSAIRQIVSFSSQRELTRERVAGDIQSCEIPRKLCYSGSSPDMSTTTNTISTSPPCLVSPSTTRIGWIGTGVMGRYMASHLLSAGFSLTVFNRTPSKAEPLLKLGAKLANSPIDVARSSDVVFLIVGYPSDVRHVVLDPATGILQGLSTGSVIVDMTTSDPALSQEIYDAARLVECSSIDAPVSGGDRGAKEGKLSIFAGGDEPTVRRIFPLFNCLGKVNYMGGAGAGQRAKLGNQIAIASTMVGLVEGMMYAHKAGLDVGAWMEAISTGAAGSKSLDLYGKRILGRDMAAGFFVHHFVKDLGICLKECQSIGLALPGLALAHQLYLSLMAHGEGNLGTQALILAVERLNNTKIGDEVPKSD